MAYDSDGNVVIEHRRIVPPASISEEARVYLVNAALNPDFGEAPALDDHEGWRRHVSEFDEPIIATLAAQSATVDATVEQSSLAGVPISTATPRQLNEAGKSRILLYLHGGGLVYLGGTAVPHWALLQCGWAGCPVVAVDYRMPPDHPYPAGIDDTVAVYRELADRHGGHRIAIAGVSAGGHFAAAAVLKIRDAGLPQPGAVLLLTPELDLTESGDTFQTNQDIDVVLRRGLPAQNALYAGGHDLSDAYLSPIFADFSRGYPPTLIQSGTRDLFLSNAVRMHRALRRHGLTADLHVGEAMPHGGLGGNSPEDLDLLNEYRMFLDKHIA